MRLKLRTTAAVVALIACGVAVPAVAQAPGRASAGGPWHQHGARPAPTLSPYLDLLRRDSGVLPPYHAFVRPRKRIAAQQQQQWQAIGKLKHDVRRASTRPDSAPLPTGRGGHFQTYLHYYPQGIRP